MRPKTTVEGHYRLYHTSSAVRPTPKDPPPRVVVHPNYSRSNYPVEHVRSRLLELRRSLAGSVGIALATTRLKRQWVAMVGAAMATSRCLLPILHSLEAQWWRTFPPTLPPTFQKLAIASLTRSTLLDFTRWASTYCLLLLRLTTCVISASISVRGTPHLFSLFGIAQLHSRIGRPGSHFLDHLSIAGFFSSAHRWLCLLDSQFATRESSFSDFSSSSSPPPPPLLPLRPPPRPFAPLTSPLTSFCRSVFASFRSWFHLVYRWRPILAE